jgi:peptide/nickel transport system permease protein
MYKQVLAMYNNKSIVLGFSLLALFILVALVPTMFTRQSPYTPNFDNILAPANGQHIFGTDELGRDLFARIIFGTRYAFIVVLSVCIVTIPLGFTIGAIAGYKQNFIGNFLSRMIDVFLALPKLIIAMALVASVGVGIKNAIFAIILTAWAPYARLTRANVLQLKQQDFILVLKLQGVSSSRILFRFIAPLCLSPIFLQAFLDMSGYILMVAGLGFLGLGAQPPLPEWGSMLANAKDYILTHWWLITYPGGAILLLSLSFNLIGEGMQSVLTNKGF